MYTLCKRRRLRPFITEDENRSNSPFYKVVDLPRGDSLDMTRNLRQFGLMLSLDRLSGSTFITGSWPLCKAAFNDIRFLNESEPKESTTYWRPSLDTMYSKGLCSSNPWGENTKQWHYALIDWNGLGGIFASRSRKVRMSWPCDLDSPQIETASGYAIPRSFQLIWTPYEIKIFLLSIMNLPC